eukprot:gb/GECG01010590.1/.p1 GENE.gb/GECG01010590.1/~~gb/GECG01010590.1/.p1  ORF type:complete len:171 (+),score=12.47 gb/GECG01010590.1/:1-513(+)
MTEVKDQLHNLMNLVEDHSANLPNDFYLNFCNQIGSVFNQIDEITNPKDPTEPDHLTQDAIEETLREEGGEDIQTTNDREFEFELDDSDSDSEYIPPSISRAERRRRRQRPNRGNVGRPRGSRDSMNTVGSIQIKNTTRTVYKTRRGKFKYWRPSGWAYIKQTQRITFTQ